MFQASGWLDYGVGLMTDLKFIAIQINIFKYGIAVYVVIEKTLE
jgi:hypothetical protein